MKKLLFLCALLVSATAPSFAMEEHGSTPHALEYMNELTVLEDKVKFLRPKTYALSSINERNWIDLRQEVNALIPSTPLVDAYAREKMHIQWLLNGVPTVGFHLNMSFVHSHQKKEVQDFLSTAQSLQEISEAFTHRCEKLEEAIIGVRALVGLKPRYPFSKI